MQTNNEDLMNCDMETGICKMPVTSNERKDSSITKPVKLIYFTDPICSACWGIEPQLRKLKQEYGAYFDIEYRMGGLLKNWDEYAGSDVNGPHSVAQHWDEASAFYDMPIDGDLWKGDPLHSSYPPAIAFKAAQLQGSHKADQFLRRIKEMVFTEKMNIAKPVYLEQAAKEVGLNHIQFIYDCRNKAKQLFEEDLFMAKKWGVRGFPTIYFIDEDDNRFKVYGSKPYKLYEQALLKLLPPDVTKETPLSYDTILIDYNTVTQKEFAVFYDKNLDEAATILQELEENNKVKKVVSKAGRIWKVRSQHWNQVIQH